MEFNIELEEKLMQCKWFENCGMSTNSEYPFDIILISSQTEAKKNIQSLDWENTCLDKIGNVTAFMSQNHRVEYRNNWNKQVIYLKEKILPFLIENIKTMLEKKEYPKEFLDDIRFNLISIIMSDKYSKYYTEEFFSKLLTVYLSGHLPCGLDNEKIIVF